VAAKLPVPRSPISSPVPGMMVKEFKNHTGQSSAEYARAVS
jgi:hypothetical protein